MSTRRYRLQWKRIEAITSPAHARLRGHLASTASKVANYSNHGATVLSRSTTSNRPLAGTQCHTAFRVVPWRHRLHMDSSLNSLLPRDSQNRPHEHLCWCGKACVSPWVDDCTSRKAPEGEGAHPSILMLGRAQSPLPCSGRQTRGWYPSTVGVTDTRSEGSRVHHHPRTRMECRM